MNLTAQPVGWVSQQPDAPSPAPVGWRNPAGSGATETVPQPPSTLNAPIDPVTDSTPGAAETAGTPETSDSSGDVVEDEADPRDVSRETTATPVADQDHRDASPRPAAPIADELVDQARRRARLQHTAVNAPDRPRIMTVANQKGGVGKTTTAVNVAAALAQSGLRVLVVDIDPQGNASTALGIDHHAEVPSIYDVVVEGRPLSEVIQQSPEIAGLWCAPATIDLAGAEIELVPMVARESRLKRAIDAFQQDAATQSFDYVLIDCPPSLGLLTVNAFVAAQEVFIPIQCEYYALEGLSQLLNNVEMIRTNLNPDLHVSTILMTMYDGRTRLSAQVADEVRAHFSEQVLRASIPRSVRISEAPSHGQTVLTYDPSSSGALSYLEAAKELAARAPKISETV